MKASGAMPRRRERAQYQQVSAFEQGRMVGLREVGLSYRDTAASRPIGDAATTVMRLWRVEGRGSYTETSRYWTT